MIILRNLLIVYLAVLVIASPVVEAASLINVPLNPDVSDFNRETYRFIHRLLNKKVLPGIPRGSLPLTYKQVVSSLLEVKQKQESGEITLSAIDQKRLNDLLAFFREDRASSKRATEAANEAAPESTSTKRHLMTHTGTHAGEDYSFYFDIRGSQRFISRLVDNVSEEPPVEGNMFVTTIYPHLYGQVGGKVCVYD